jgi:hypothetical protein
MFFIQILRSPEKLDCFTILFENVDHNRNALTLMKLSVFCTTGGAALLAKGAVDFAGKSNDSFFFWFNMVTTTTT